MIPKKQRSLTKCLLALVIYLSCCCDTVEGGFVVKSHHHHHHQKACSSGILKRPMNYNNNIRAHTTTRHHHLLLSELVSSSSVVETLATTFPMGTVPPIYSMSLNFILFTALKFKLDSMLTTAGYWHAFALGTGLWSTLGWKGWTLCVTYLFLGQAVTKVKFAQKEQEGIAEKRGGRRGPENVWGSAATGIVCAVCAALAEASNSGLFLGLSKELFALGYVSSLATKLADTFGSEIGKAYGKTTFLITTLQPVRRGTEGAVSLEGTAASFVGGALLASYGLAVGLVVTLPQFAVATVAAFLATIAESLIGASLQDEEGFEWLSNEAVNFIMTIIGAVIAMGAGKMVLGM